MYKCSKMFGATIISSLIIAAAGLSVGFCVGMVSSATLIEAGVTAALLAVGAFAARRYFND